MPEPQNHPRAEQAFVRSRPKKVQPIWPFITAASVLAFGMIVVVIVFNAGSPSASSTSGPKVAEAEPSETLTPTASDAATEEASSTAAEQAVDDPKGELLWVSPTEGPPISLAYVPAGTQCLVHLRPAVLLSQPEGERMVAALGPWGQGAVADLKTMLGGELADVDSLLLTIVPNVKGGLDVGMRAHFSNELSNEDLERRFPTSSQQQHGGLTYRLFGEWACFVPPKAADAKTLVVCPASLAEELIDSAGEPPALVRDVEALVEHTDADRIATVIVAPKFLEAGGSELLLGDAKPVKEALHWLTGNDATAVALSAHWDKNFFVELRAAPALNVPPRRLALKLRERIATAPNAVEDIVASANWPAYGRKVLARFPSMLRALTQYSRAAEDDREALVRCYLPIAAGHNLVMASELLLTQPHSAEASASSPATPAAQPVTSIEDRIAKKTSLVFTKDSLERALEMLADDIGVGIAIEGKDLQLDGITKNQSLAMDMHDKPAAEILVEILRRANPDRTATGPDDPKQKLVYVVQPGRNGDAGRIIVTTRAAAAKRGDRLPTAFLPKKG